MGPLALAVTGGAAYALLSHLLMVHAAGAPWAVAALLGPLLALTGAWAWRGRHWLLAAGTGAAALVVAGVVARGGVADVKMLYVLQHVGVHLALGASFALSLRGPGPSLVGRIARHVEGSLTPALLAYTRKVTLAWVAYFLGMAALSLAVYRFAPWTAWSLLANIGTPAVIAGMFIAEVLLRRRLHPEFKRAGVADTVRAYQRDGAAGR